jgi:hypothetical protein
MPRCEDGGHHAIRAGDIADLEDRQVHQRRGDAALVPHERGEQHRGQEQAAEGPRIGPAPDGSLAEGEDAGHQAERDDERAAGVERAADAVVRVRGDQPRNEDADDDADRNVDEEVPAPARVLRQDPAEQQSDGGDHRPVAERSGAGAAFGEGDEHDRERGRGHERGGHALDAAQRDEQRHRGVDADEERDSREREHARDQRLSPPEQIGHAPAEQ